MPKCFGCDEEFNRLNDDLCSDCAEFWGEAECHSIMVSLEQRLFEHDMKEFVDGFERITRREN